MTMRGTTNVFLIGPMGSGKTAVGRHVARALGLPFYDSDTEIERRTGVDIPFIFEKEGEAGFRQREREAIEALTRWSASCSPPGAAPCCCRRTAATWPTRGCVVYLETSVTQQVRPRAPRAQPPAVAQRAIRAAARGADGRARAALCADRGLMVSTDGRRVQHVAEAVLRALGHPRPESAAAHVYYPRGVRARCMVQSDAVDTLYVELAPAATRS